MKRLSFFLLGLCLSLSAGADPGETDSTRAAATDLRPVSFEGWKQVLLDLQGNIAVVDFWAGWCSPCIERFPSMVEMHHEFHDRGVRFLSLNLDEQGDLEAIGWANEFLARIEAVIPNYHMDENMTEAFRRLDLLGLPVVVIYDAEGNEAYRLTGDNPNRQFNEGDVENAVLELLGR